MVKLITYSLITALSVATYADLHIRNPLFTRSLFQAASEDLVTLPYTILDWSTHVINRWTELWWLQHATAVAAVA